MTSFLESWSRFPHFGIALWQSTYQVYLTGTLLVTAIYSGIEINTGDCQSMSCDSSTRFMSSSHEHFAYITLPAPIMEYLESATLELFHHENGLVHYPI